MGKAISAGRLVELYEAVGEDQYYDELDALLGMARDDDGFKTIKDPILKPRQLSILDIGEAFVGRQALQTLYDRPFGVRGGRARTTLEVGEEVGAGALGPSQFQAINAWLGTTSGLLGAEVLARYEEAVKVARSIVTWQTDVRAQEPKLPRYSRPTLPTEDLQPNQEFPAGNLTAEFVRANRMSKQGEAISVTWEASHFDQTGDLMDAAGTVADGIGYNVENKVLRTVLGIEQTYKYNDTQTDTYRTTGSYINKLTNELTTEDAALNNAEMQLLSQTDPATGRPLPFTGQRLLITSQFRSLTAARLARATQYEVGAASDPSRYVVPPTITQITPIISQFIIPLLTTPDPRFGWAGLTLAQAKEYWWYGDTKRAFKYRSAKDLTSYSFNIADDPSLARRDVLMEMDVSEFGSTTIIDPRFVIENIKT